MISASHLTASNKLRRWVYIIEGAGTMIVGRIAFLLLPDFPRFGKKWLTEQEQRLA